VQHARNPFLTCFFSLQDTAEIVCWRLRDIYFLLL